MADSISMLFVPEETGPQCSAPPRTVNERAAASRIARWSVRDAIVGLSFSTLTFLRVWSELLIGGRAEAFFVKTPPGAVSIWAVLLNSMVVAGAIWLAKQVLWQRCGPAWRTLLRWVFVAGMILPLNAIRLFISGPSTMLFAYVRSPVLRIIGREGALVAAASIVLVLLATLIFGHRRAARAARHLLLVAAPLGPILVAQTGWLALHIDRGAFDDAARAAPIQGARERRVVWIVFDEWDQALTFDRAGADAAFPELARFRRSASFAQAARPPAGVTLHSVPALISGRMVSQATPLGARDMEIRFAGASAPVRWSRQQTVFSAARALGFNTTVIGWYLPYCRVWDGEITRCSWWEADEQRNNLGTRLGPAMWNQSRSLFETVQLSAFGQSLATAGHARTFSEMLLRLRTEASRMQSGLLFAHLPVPHPPFFYDRTTGRFTLANAPMSGYLSQLQLVDRSVGELRRTMEQAGNWEGTTVILSSDHWYRQANTVSARLDRRVPFLLKLAGQQEARCWSTPFNTVITHDLVLAILAGDIRTSRAAEAWLRNYAAAVDPL